MPKSPSSPQQKRPASPSLPCPRLMSRAASFSRNSGMAPAPVFSRPNSRPCPGDMRFAGSSNATGFQRPFIWNPHTGQRQELQSDQFRGDITVWAWSPDGARLLLHQVHQALHKLYVYDIANNNAILLDAPAGSSAAGYFVENGNIYLHWNDAANPPSLIEIDGATGAYLRDVIDLKSDLPVSRRLELCYLPLRRRHADSSLAGDAGRRRTIPDHRAHTRRAYRRADKWLVPGLASVARSGIRLLQSQLPRLDHLRLRLPACDRRQSG